MGKRRRNKNYFYKAAAGRKASLYCSPMRPGKESIVGAYAD